MKLDEKKKIVAEMHDKFLRSQVVILSDYKGLNVDQVNDLRRKLREVDVEFKVVKNTLLTRAAEDTDADLIKDQFKGPSAIAFSYDDPVVPAKVLTDFAKANKAFELKAGVMNGKVLDPDSIKSLSSLPSREVLLSQVLSVMTAVPTSFVRVLNGVPQKMLNVLLAIKEKKEAA